VITAFVTKRLAVLDRRNANMATRDVSAYLDVVPVLLRSPNRFFSSSYDAEADVLYIELKRAVQPTNSQLTDDDVIVRYENGEVVGLTVLHASKR
jgi:uncharacterized protein YuzE